MPAPSLEEQKRLHALAVSHFLSCSEQNLSYKFSSALIPLPEEDANMLDRRRRAPCPKAWSRFVFSKPTQTQPEPMVLVTVDVETVEEKEDGTVIYSMLPEGQTLRRPIIFDPQHPEQFFCEELLNNVYKQKMATIEKYRN